MPRSRYDELHDRYYRIATSKSGTRYERLAALVFKSLDEHQIVIHDLRLRGETGVEHQIDVTIEIDGNPRNVLIECKDFDLSGNKVGLDIVRNFWAVMDDTKPDEGIVISCNDFTADARIYAKSKGIRLAVLCVFREGDWEDKLREIELNLAFRSTTSPSVELKMGDERRLDQINRDFIAAGVTSTAIGSAQRVYLNFEGHRVQFGDFVRQKINDAPKDSLGPTLIEVPMDGSTIQVAEMAPVPLMLLTIRFEVFHERREVPVGANKLAELILRGFGDSDVVVFDDDLKRFQIDPATRSVNPA